MTVAASEGIFAFGPQTAKGSVASTWYRHKASRVGVGPQQVIQQFPQEIGGGIHPTGAYKSMAFGGGQAIMNPRLENVIGWLMYATVGTVSDIADTPEAGMTRHRFTPPANYYDMKWLSIRRLIPGATGASDNLGEVLTDCRAVGMRLALSPANILTSAHTFVGRQPQLSGTGVDSWTWGNTYERYPSVPLAHQGSFTVGGASLPATALSVDLVNGFTGPQEEMIIGSPYPDDFILQRQIPTLTWTYKWHNPSLYQSLLCGSNVESDGVIDWSPTVHTSTVDFAITSPGNATGMSNPWRLHFYAPEVTWQAAGPPELMAGGWLALQFTGVAQEQTAADTFYFELDNLTANYTWPS